MSACTRCKGPISTRTPSEGVTQRIGLTKTTVSWRLTFSRFRWHWLPKNPQDRVTGSYSELDVCDWCAGDVFLFAQGLPPRPPRVNGGSRPGPVSATRSNAPSDQPGETS